MAQKYPNKIPIPVMQDGTPINLPSKNFLNGTGGIPLRGGNVAVLPNAPQQPQINPMEVYKNLGINATQQGNYFMPNTYADLQKGIENGLNFGNKQLADSYKNPFYTKDTALQGIQQNKNFGNPFLASLEKQQGFLPKNEIAVNNIQPEQATIQQNEIVNPPAHQNTFMENFKQHPFQTIGKGLESPIGRGLLVGALGMATGVNPMLSAGYGFNTMANNYNSRTQDIANRALYKAATGNDYTGGGYLTDEAMKNYTDSYSKFETLNTKKAANELKQKLIDSKDRDSAIKAGIEIWKQGGTTGVELEKMLATKGLSLADIGISNDSKKTESVVKVNNSKVTLNNANENYIKGAKTENTEADTGYKIQKTTESKVLLPGKVSLQSSQYAKNIHDANKPYFKPSGSGGKVLTVGQTDQISAITDSINSLDQIKRTYSAKDKGDLFGASGIIKRGFNNSLGMHTDAEANMFNQDVGIAKQIIGKDIEKGRMSDSDRNFYQKTLFNPNASQKDFVNAIDKYIKDKKNQYNTKLQTFGQAGYNISNFNGYGQQQPKTNIQAGQTIGRFKVVKVH